MKLFGGRSKPKKRSSGGYARQSTSTGYSSNRSYRTEEDYRRGSGTPTRQLAEPDRTPRNTNRKKKKKRGKGLLIALLIIAIIMAAIAIYYKLTVKPPEVTQHIDSKPTATVPAVTDKGSSGTAPQVTAGRSEDEFTFVLVGTDAAADNTDTIMVANFNVSEGTVNVISIPRDTLVNVEWAVKKVNTFYSAAGGPEGVVDGLSDILGFKVDFYVVVDLDAFVECVDAIGGVWYDVPMDMDYETEDVSIHLTKGYQLLDGSKAVQFVRFRSGYANADIGRIGAQQGFLKAAVEQILENKDKLSITTLADLFLNYVDTDLTYGNLIWFAQEFLKMDSMDVTFQTLPGNYGDYVHQGGMDVSYVTIYVDEWLDMVNQYINPFTVDITENDVSILTRDPDTDELYSTDGVYQDDPSWGN
jgi:LCP family protein required for cell wall assembly